MISNNTCREVSLRKAFKILALILSLAGSAGAATWTVDDSGGANSTRIQDVIDNASDGDTVLVYSGKYYEKVIVNKQLILKGIDTGGGKPVVDASGNGPAIVLTAGNSTLEGFMAVNASSAIFPSSDSNAGVYVYSSNNKIINNTASSNEYGIYMISSSNNVLIGNIANSNENTGIHVHSSSNNTLSNNTASNNTVGITLYYSSNNTFTNNQMSGNKYNFRLGESSDSLYDNQINTSNLVNGKPIYYVKDAVDTVYDSSTNAGAFYCINCINITVKDINLNNNSEAIYFWKTNYSTVQNVNVSNNNVGIFLFFSNNNTLSGNYVWNNNEGIDMGISKYNTLTGNNISNNEAGIGLGNSNNNILSGNNVSNNGFSVFFHYPGFSDNNIIYNNIFNNISNFYNSVNKWNITKTPGINIIGGPYLGGNFWTNPNSTGFSQACSDSDKDGICDSPYMLDGSNSDYLPLAITSQLPPELTGSISGNVTNVATGTGIPNVTVRLVGIVGMNSDIRQVRAEITTDSAGRWIFDNLPAGRYVIIEQVQKGFIPVTPPVMNIMLAKSENSINNNFMNKPVEKGVKLGWFSPGIF